MKVFANVFWVALLDEITPFENLKAVEIVPEDYWLGHHGKIYNGEFL